MADIPGLIEGASNGSGLGDQFLKHIERTKLLIHVLDAAGSEGRDPFDDFHIINKELAMYSSVLTKKKQIVAANKTDLIQDNKKLDYLCSKIKAEGYDIFPICTLTGEGISELMEAVWKMLQEIPEQEIPAPNRTIVYEIPKIEFTVECVDNVYKVKGKRLEKLVSMTNFDNPVSLRHFERSWHFMGLDKLLIKEGVKEGDTVDLYGFEFTFSENNNEDKEGE